MLTRLKRLNEELDRLLKEAEQELEISNKRVIIESIDDILRKYANKKKGKWRKNPYKKTTSSEEDMLRGKIASGEYFEWGDNTAIIETSNHSYLVELYFTEDVPVPKVIRKRKIK